MHSMNENPNPVDRRKLKRRAGNDVGAESRNLARKTALITACGVIALAASYIGLFARPATGGKRPAPHSRPIVVHDAVQLAASPTADGRHLEVWRAVAEDGRRCIFVQVKDAPSASVDTASGRAECYETDPAAVIPNAKPIEATVDWTLLTNGEYQVIVDGRVSSTAGIDRLDLQTSETTDGADALHRPIKIGIDGYFVLDLPRVAVARTFADGKFLALVAYSVGGHEILKYSLNDLVTRSSP